MRDPCIGCNYDCWWLETCPECGGSGIFIGAGIDSIDEPTFYGLRHPLNLLESCRLCGGDKVITVYCRYY